MRRSQQEARANDQEGAEKFTALGLKHAGTSFGHGSKELEWGDPFWFEGGTLFCALARLRKVTHMTWHASLKLIMANVLSSLETEGPVVF